jgi:hypothetical protein
VRIHGDPLSEVAIVARICGAIHTTALNQRLPREALVRKTLEGVPVSEAFVARLTGRKGLTRAQIQPAVRFAKLASTPGAETDGAGTGAMLSGGHTALTESLIDRQLKNADLALGNKADAPGRCSVTSYDLFMRHVKSRFKVPCIVEALKTRGHGTLFLRRSGHRQDRAGRAPGQGAGAAFVDQAGERPDKQIRG